MVDVVHCKKEPYDIYIGRPSKWQNPFHLLDPKDEIQRGICLTRFTEWVLKQENLIKDLPEIKNKTLGCWCAPRLCHGDILYCLANKEDILLLIIAGGREFSDYILLKKEVDLFIEENKKDYKEIVIISGEARGADLLGKKYGEEKGYKVIRLPALWKNVDDSVDIKAGFKRNAIMLKLANHCIVFWDQKSNGTRMMIKIAEPIIKTKVISYS